MATKSSKKIHSLAGLEAKSNWFFLSRNSTKRLHRRIFFPIPYFNLLSFLADDGLVA
jgi:hypothetical protein